MSSATDALIIIIDNNALIRNILERYILPIEVHSGTSQASQMELYARIVRVFK